MAFLKHFVDMDGMWVEIHQYIRLQLLIKLCMIAERLVKLALVCQFDVHILAA